MMRAAAVFRVPSTTRSAIGMPGSFAAICDAGQAIGLCCDLGASRLIRAAS
jgi:hypothetical protein